MANALGTISSTIVLIGEVLDTLLCDFPILSQITRDWSDKDAKWNQQITSHVVVPSVAIEHDATAGYVAADRTELDVNLTINHQAEHTFAITDREQSATDTDLRARFRKTAAHALGTKIVADLFGTITAASFPLAYPQASANFDAADVRRIKTLLNKNNVPDLERYGVVNSDFAEGLGLDNVVIANPNGSNADVINSGRLPNIHGFRMSEFAQLAGPAGESLAGIFGNREALLMATRTPSVPADGREIPGLIVNVTEPNTKLTIQYRSWYQMNPPKAFEVLTVMYGFNVGLSEAGVTKRAVRLVG